MSEDRLARLEKNISYLMDRRAIEDCIARYARGCDRHDTELLTSTLHEDGFDEHGFAVNPGPKYAEFANTSHSAAFQQNMHHVTMTLCDIEGDVAHTESYVIGLFLDHDGNTGRLLSGRYADRLERRDGEWKIALRRSTLDVLLTGDSSAVNTDFFKEMGYLKGMRDKRDVSYQRPLTLEETFGERW